MCLIGARKRGNGWLSLRNIRSEIKHAKHAKPVLQLLFSAYWHIIIKTHMAVHPKKNRTAMGSRQRIAHSGQQALRAQGATHPHPEVR